MFGETWTLFALSYHILSLNVLKQSSCSLDPSWALIYKLPAVGHPGRALFLTKRKWLSALPAVSEAAVVLGRFLDTLRSGESKDLRIGKCCNMILGCFTPSFVIISCDYGLNFHSKTSTCIVLWVPFPPFQGSPKADEVFLLNPQA